MALSLRWLLFPHFALVQQWSAPAQVDSLLLVKLQVPLLLLGLLQRLRRLIKPLSAESYCFQWVPLAGTFELLQGLGAQA
jgi:hypothetical protein